MTSSGGVLDIPQRTVPQGPYFKVVKPSLVRLDSLSSAHVEVAKYRCDLGELQRSRMLRFVLPRSAFDRANWFVLNNVDVFARCKTGDGLAANSFAATPIVASRAAIFLSSL